jgi:anti-anti-sigma regulatory factor
MVVDDTVVLPMTLVGDEVDRLRPKLLGAVRDSARPVVDLDAGAVELISSAGLGLLVAAALLARDQGKRLEVRRSSELFRSSIALTGLARHLGMEPAPTP